MSAPIIYDLTPMTRNADEQRRWVIKGFDLPKRGILIGGIAFIPGIIITAFLFNFFGIYSVFSLAIVELIAFWAFEGRSRQGMKLRNYQTILDKRRTKEGQFFICGNPIDISDHEVTYVRQRTVPVNRKARSHESLFGHDADNNTSSPYTGSGWDEEGDPR